MAEKLIKDGKVGKGTVHKESSQNKDSESVDEQVKSEHYRNIGGNTTKLSALPAIFCDLERFHKAAFEHSLCNLFRY